MKWWSPRTPSLCGLVEEKFNLINLVEAPLMSDKMSKVHIIRKQWQTTRTQMFLTCQKINELEEELAQARATKRTLQRELTSLEVSEKELLGEVKSCGKASEVIKIKIRKSVASSINEAFSTLSKEQQEDLVKSLLEGIL